MKRRGCWSSFRHIFPESGAVLIYAIICILASHMKLMLTPSLTNKSEKFMVIPKICVNCMSFGRHVILFRLNNMLSFSQ